MTTTTEPSLLEQRAHARDIAKRRRDNDRAELLARLPFTPHHTNGGRLTPADSAERKIEIHRARAEGLSTSECATLFKIDQGSISRANHQGADLLAAMEDTDPATPGASPADIVAETAIAASNGTSAHTDSPQGLREQHTGSQPRRAAVKVSLRSFADIADDVPTWAWTYADKGRIPVGGMTLFAGRPGAGKSTSARWFAAQVTRGTLPGVWHGTPHNVAYIAAEESPKYSVKPSLRAAGADTAHVFFPEAVAVQENGETNRYSRIPAAAMDSLAQELRDADVKLVVVDPLMSVLGDGVDAHRSNEVREHLTPWMNLAEQIDGVVLGIVHLNKSGNGDVVAGINGSSAFGELARAAFGFTKDPDSAEGDRVMSQEKNSLGTEDLALTYRLTSVPVTTASGKTAEMPRFDIVGESDRTVGDILRDGNQRGPEDGSQSDAEVWLEDYLRGHGTHPKKEVIAAARKDGHTVARTVERAFKKIGGHATYDGFPRVAQWSLPDDVGEIAALGG